MQEKEDKEVYKKINKKGDRLMLVFLEGNECVYKSTVAKKLGERLGYEVKRGSSFEMSKGSNEDLYQSFVKMAFDREAIYDRYIVSNRVYATLYAGYTILSDSQYREVSSLLRKRGVIVYLYASEDELKRRMRERGDEHVNEDMLGAINEGYEVAIGELNTKNVLMINTEESTSDEIVEEIVRYLGK